MQPAAQETKAGIWAKVAASLRALPTDCWNQVIVWIATTAIFPILVFVGYVLAGGTLASQIDLGQLLLIAAALTAPVVGAMITLPGDQTVGRTMLFALAFVHITVTIFYFSPIASSATTARHVIGNSVWLYVLAVLIGTAAVVVTSLATEQELERRVQARLTELGRLP